MKQDSNCGNEALAATTVDQTALRLIQQAAEGGKAEAQYRLGLMYADQDGLPLDYREASKWLRRAAEQDHAQAQGMLGWLYANGFGVEQDGVEAARWYEKSAERGVAQGQYLLATMYRVGSNGMTQDSRPMLYWYRQSAEQGFAPAQNMLGKLMRRGKYVARDLMGAFQWFSLAIMSGSDSARNELGEMVKEMTPKQIYEAQEIFLAALESRGVDVSIVRQAFGGGEGHVL